MVTPRPELWRRKRWEALLMASGPKRAPTRKGGPGARGARRAGGGARYGLGPEAGADAEGGARVEGGAYDGGVGVIEVAHVREAHEGAHVREARGLERVCGFVPGQGALTSPRVSRSGLRFPPGLGLARKS